MLKGILYNIYIYVNYIYKYDLSIYKYYLYKYINIPVVPHKAVAEVSKTGNL